MKRPAALPEAMAASDAVVSSPPTPLAAETVEGASPAAAAKGADLEYCRTKGKGQGQSQGESKIYRQG